MYGKLIFFYFSFGHGVKYYIRLLILSPTLGMGNHEEIDTTMYVSVPRGLIHPDFRRYLFK